MNMIENDTVGMVNRNKLNRIANSVNINGMTGAEWESAIIAKARDEGIDESKSRAYLAAGDI